MSHAIDSGLVMTNSFRLAWKGGTLTHSMENYLKVIFEILERQDRATTSSIADRMSLAAPSVTAMIKKLAELRLVTHEPYQGVRLTRAGEMAAAEVVRHHRLI